MSNSSLPEGLYLLRQSSGQKWVQHYAILDLGHRSGFRLAGWNGPVLVHQRPPGIRVEPFRGAESWELVARVLGESAAVARMRAAMTKPTYNLFGHNCEQFARYVALGRWESTQLQAVSVVVGFGALVWIGLRHDTAVMRRRSHKVRRRRAIG